MDELSNKQTKFTYEPPALVEVGDFANDTRGNIVGERPEGWAAPVGRYNPILTVLAD
jgi:hypothetical protein